MWVCKSVSEIIRRGELSRGKERITGIREDFDHETSQNARPVELETFFLAPP